MNSDSRVDLDKISPVNELCSDSGTPLVSIVLVLDGKASVGE